MADKFKLSPDISSSAFQDDKSTLEGHKGTVSGFDMKLDKNDADTWPDAQTPAPWDDLNMDEEKQLVADDLQISVERVEHIIKNIECVKNNHTGLQNALKAECDSIQNSYGVNKAFGGDDNKQCRNCDNMMTDGYPDMSGYGAGGFGGAGGATGGDEGFDDEDENDDEEEKEEELEEEETEEEEEKEEEEEEEEEDEVIDVEPIELPIDKIGYMYIDSLTAGTDAYKLFNDYPDLIQYDENGYARIHPEVLPEDKRNEEVDIVGKEARYVISCNSSVAKVGEVLRFTQKNGDVVECVVGYNQDNTGNENTMKFIINKESVENVEDKVVFNKTTPICKDILTENDKFYHIEEQYSEVNNESLIAEKDTVIQDVEIGELV